MVVERLAGWIPVARTVVFAFVGECCVGRLEAPNMGGGRRYWIYLIAGDYWKKRGDVSRSARRLLSRALGGE